MNTNIEPSLFGIIAVLGDSSPIRTPEQGSTGIGMQSMLIPVFFINRFSADGSSGFPQRLKSAIGIRVRKEEVLDALARCLSVEDTLLAVKCDYGKHGLEVQAGMVVTEWANRNGLFATEENFDRRLRSAGLSFLSCDTVMSATSHGLCSHKPKDENILNDYLEYVVRRNRWIRILGTSGEDRGHRVALERVYVELRLSHDVAYQVAHQEELVDPEVKAFLARRGIDWNELTVDEKFHHFQSYLCDLPPSSKTNELAEDSVPVACAFRDERTLVMLGDPGSGKTTMGRWLALMLAEALLKGRERVELCPDQVFLSSSPDQTFDMGRVRLPVFVRVSEFAEYLRHLEGTESQFDHALLDFFGSRDHGNEPTHDPSQPYNMGQLFGPCLHALIRGYLSQGDATIILDGLDELVSVKERRLVVQCIENVMRVSTGNRFVITSRIAGYREAPMSNRHAVHSVVQPMSRFAIDKFVDCWMNAVDREEGSKVGDASTVELDRGRAALALKKAIYNRQNPNVFMLASNPLLLTLIINIFWRNGKLPQHRARLYEDIIHFFISTWRQGVCDCTEFDDAILRRALCDIGYHTHSSRPSGCFRKADLTSRLTSTCTVACSGEQQLNPFRMQALVGRLVSKLQETVGLIIERKQDSFSFIHLSFQEFLAGCELVENPISGCQAILKHVSDPRWKHPILLALGYASIQWPQDHFTSLLTDLIQHDDVKKDLVPHLSLFVAEALPECNSESIAITMIHKLVECLFSFHSKQFRYRSHVLRGRTEAALRALCVKQLYRNLIRDVLEARILSEDQYVVCSASHLVMTLTLMTPTLDDLLTKQMFSDLPELGWPIHGGLKTLSLPDVERCFQTQLDISEVHEMIAATKTDLRGEHCDKTHCLERLKKTYEACIKGQSTASQKFVLSWRQVLKTVNDMATRTSGIVSHHISPELGLHGVELLEFQRQFILGSCLLQAVLIASVLLYKDLSERLNNSNEALIIIAKLVGCLIVTTGEKSIVACDKSKVLPPASSYVETPEEWSLIAHTLEIISAGSGLYPSPEHVIHQQVDSVVKLLSDHFESEILRTWIARTVVVYGNLVAVTTDKSTSAALHIAARRIVAEGTTLLRTRLHMSELPVISLVSREEVKATISTIVTEGLKENDMRGDWSDSELTAAAIVLQLSLDMLDFHDRQLSLVNELEEARQLYHGHVRQRGICRLQLLVQRINHVANRSLHGWRNIPPSGTMRQFMRRPDLVRSLLASPILSRVFAAVYGGLANVGAQSALECVQRRKARLHISPVAILQFLDRFSASTANRSEYLAVLEELEEREFLLHSAVPCIRVDYMYRSTSSLDRVLVDMMKRPSISDSEVRDACTSIIFSSSPSLTQCCDSALALTALGGISETLSYLSESGRRYRFEITMSLAESLKSTSDSAIRAITHLSSAGLFQALPHDEWLTLRVKWFLQLNQDLGGKPGAISALNTLEANLSNGDMRVLIADALSAVVCTDTDACQKEKTYEICKRFNPLELAEVVIALCEAASVRWWGRIRWLTLPRHRLCRATNAEDTYCIDLLLVLIGLCRCQSELCQWLLERLHPVGLSMDLQLLWESFQLVVETKLNRCWMDVGERWNSIEDKATATDNVFVRGQLLIVKAYLFAKEGGSVIGQVLQFADELSAQGSLASCQLLAWTLLLFPADSAKMVLPRLKTTCQRLLCPYDRARAFCFVSSLVPLRERDDLLFQSLESLKNDKDSERLAAVLDYVNPYILHSTQREVAEAFRQMTTQLPEALSSMLNDDVLERCVTDSSVDAGNLGNIVLLAANLRDTLVATQSCTVVKNEDYLWSAMLNENKRIRDLARWRLDEMKSQGCLDLSLHSALVLDALIREYVFDLLPYVRCADLEALFVLKKWLWSKETEIQKVLAFPVCGESSCTVRDVVLLILAEEEGLNCQNTLSVINILSSDVDICRCRAEKLFSDYNQRYLTGSVDASWLFLVTRAYIDLFEAGRPQSSIVQWIFRHIYHSNIHFYNVLLNKAKDPAATNHEEAIVLLRRVFAVNCVCGEQLLDTLQQSSSVRDGLLQAVFLSLCDVCYSDSHEDRTATDEFFERLPHVCRTLLKEPSALDGVSVYIGSAHDILREADRVGELFPVYCEKNLPSSGSTAQYELTLTGLTERFCRNAKTMVQSRLGIVGYPKISLSSSTWFLPTVEDVGATKSLLGSMTTWSWVLMEDGFEPGRKLTDQARLCRPENVINVLLVWCKLLLQGHICAGCEDHICTKCSLLDGMFLCLTEVSTYSARTFSSVVQNCHADLSSSLFLVAKNNRSFRARRAAVFLLAILGRISKDVVDCLTLCVRDNVFVKYAVLMSAERYHSSDDKGIKALCDVCFSLSRGSAITVTMATQILSSLASNMRLISSQRSLVMKTLLQLMQLCEDDPIVLLKPEAKTLALPTVGEVVTKAVVEVAGFSLEDQPLVPFQLGKPDVKGIYSFVTNFATPIWYRYSTTRDYWYWTPYEDYQCWMPVSVLTVSKGEWEGQTPVAANQRLIRYLFQVNPLPSFEGEAWSPE